MIKINCRIGVYEGRSSEEKMFGRSRPCKKISVLHLKGKEGRTRLSSVLLRNSGEPLLELSHQNISMRINQSFFEFTNFLHLMAPPTSMEILVRRWIGWHCHQYSKI